jgi:cytochrome c oxidase subunit 2
MPNQNLNAYQVQDLAAFFAWVGQVDTNNWPPQPIANLAGGSTPSGQLLFQQKGCIGCHKVNGAGADGPGPDLSHIATVKYDALDNTPAFLAKWLADPPAQKPGTAMPNLGLSQADIDALVQYLSTLQ